MKRRKFGLLASSSLLGLTDLKLSAANAQTAPNAALLQTTLTPLGGERAGNADGSIPAWTGGYTTVPADYKPGDHIGELFPQEQPVVIIDASNMAQHSDRICEGASEMMTKYGWSIHVYPSHRTAAAPQKVYDAIAANVGRATLAAGGGRLGFANAFGGIPFPIPDTSDPLVAGAQILWNHNTRWQGYAQKFPVSGWSISNGNKAMAFQGTQTFDYPYYLATSLETYNGITDRLLTNYTGPPNLAGQALLLWAYSNPYLHPQAVWELENGEGRVRRAPEVSFDTPASQTNGIGNYDEFNGFNGSLEKYDWKCLGKQEVYVPYNNNGLFSGSAQTALMEHFIDPKLVRFELHRCWVVEATLHPGERNVLARRKFYIDEDTFVICTGAAWDADDNLIKVNLVYNYVRPEVPAVIFGNSTIHNLQTDNYTATDGLWDLASEPGQILFFDSLPNATFDANSMAADSQY